MGAREDFENAVRRGDFLGAAEAWVIEPPEPGASLKAFQSKLDSSLAGRTVAIGETLLSEAFRLAQFDAQSECDDELVQHRMSAAA